MARAILVIGEPGTGKSRAIKNLDPKETVIIKPNSKELPFRGGAKSYILGKNMFVVKSLVAVGKLLDEINKAPKIKNIVIEDLTHYFSKRVIDERGTKGYDKWTELAAHTKLYIIDKESELRADMNLFIIGHVTATQDAAGKSSVNIQTPGKLMDNSIKIPSYFTYIFHTFVDEDEDGVTQYRFLTNKDGVREAKTPEEMFPKFIPNDYKAIIDTIEAYQKEEGIVQIGLTLEEKAKLDATKAPAKVATKVVTEEVKESHPEAATGTEAA